MFKLKYITAILFSIQAIKSVSNLTIKLLPSPHYRSLGPRHNFYWLDGFKGSEIQFNFSTEKTQIVSFPFTSATKKISGFELTESELYLLRCVCAIIPDNWTKVFLLCESKEVCTERGIHIEHNLRNLKVMSYEGLLFEISNQEEADRPVIRNFFTPDEYATKISPKIHIPPSFILDLANIEWGILNVQIEELKLSSQSVYLRFRVPTPVPVLITICQFFLLVEYCDKDGLHKYQKPINRKAQLAISEKRCEEFFNTWTSTEHEKEEGKSFIEWIAPPLSSKGITVRINGTFCFVFCGQPRIVYNMKIINLTPETEKFLKFIQETLIPKDWQNLIYIDTSCCIEKTNEIKIKYADIKLKSDLRILTAVRESSSSVSVYNLGPHFNPYNTELIKEDRTEVLAHNIMHPKKESELSKIQFQFPTSKVTYRLKIDGNVELS